MMPQSDIAEDPPMAYPPDKRTLQSFHIVVLTIVGLGLGWATESAASAEDEIARLDRVRANLFEELVRARAEVAAIRAELEAVNRARDAARAEIARLKKAASTTPARSAPARQVVHGRQQLAPADSSTASQAQDTMTSTGLLVGSGRAVWYQHPGRTASGEVYNPDGLTAAHRTLPFGTSVRVVNKENGRSIVLRINDRINTRVLPEPNYIIDLSRGSARALGIESVGSVDIYRLPPVTASPDGDVVEIRMHGTPDGSHAWFDPVGVLVQPGQTIRWVNLDPVYRHTTTAYHPKNSDHSLGIPNEAAPWNSDYLRPNETFSIRVTEEGVYDYFCIPHEKSGMVGRIVVGRPVGPTGQLIANTSLESAVRGRAKPTQLSFPSVEEIIRLGVIRAHPAVP
jgi:rare lipoprotein A (peptidoglycan hydrolase)